MNPRTTADRYQGRPLLRLLDCYILSLTGSLDGDMEAKVAAVTQSTFGGSSDWRATLRRAVNLPPDFDERVRDLWRAQPSSTEPRAFALAVSDANFLDMIDPV